MLRKIIPDVICDQKPVQLAGGASVHEAAKSMRKRNVGCVLVVKEGRQRSPGWETLEVGTRSG